MSAASGWALRAKAGVGARASQDQSRAAVNLPVEGHVEDMMLW